MTNTVICSVFLLLIVIILCVIIVSFIQKNLRDFKNIFYLLCLIIIMWIVCDIFFYLFESQELMQLFFRLRISFISSISVLIFLFTLKFYRKDNSISAQFKIILFVIPLITFLLALTGSKHNLIFYDWTLIENLPIKKINYKNSVWAYVSMCYSFLFVFLSFILVITQHFQIPKRHRLASIIYLVSILFLFITSIIETVTKFNIDYSVISYSISVIFIFMSVVGSSDIDFLVIARNDIFNFLDEYIFILDNSLHVVELNEAAVEWLQNIGFYDVTDIYFPKIFEHLKKMDAKINDNESKGMGIDVHLLLDSQYIFYNVRRKRLTSNNTPIGLYVSFLDVTRYKIMINELEKTAGIDPLTGLSNRFVYEHNKKILDNKQYYPLSIILGDVNGLKKVNDTMGHQHGDVLLKIIGLHIKKCCPKKATIARVGGDEFFILLPNTTKEESLNIVKKIQYSISLENRYNFQPSISMGVATKTSIEENLEELIHEADVNMYKQKGANRRKD